MRAHSRLRLAARVPEGPCPAGSSPPPSGSMTMRRPASAPPAIGVQRSGGAAPAGIVSLVNGPGPRRVCAVKQTPAEIVDSLKTSLITDLATAANRAHLAD